MATKCITITEEAYNRLAAKKESYESFSDVINRITHKFALSDLVGLLSPKEADEMKKHLKESRKKTEEKLSRIAGMMQ